MSWPGRLDQWDNCHLVYTLYCLVWTQSGPGLLWSGYTIKVNYIGGYFPPWSGWDHYLVFPLEIRAGWEKYINPFSQVSKSYFIKNIWKSKRKRIKIHDRKIPLNKRFSNGWCQTHYIQSRWEWVPAVQCWPDMGTVGRNNQLNVYIRVQAVQSTHLVVRGCQWK